MDENRTYTLMNSTIIQNIGCVCRLAVISPTVSTWIPLAKSPGRAEAGRLAADGPMPKGTGCRLSEAAPADFANGVQVDTVGEVGWAGTEGYAAAGPPRRRSAML